MVISRCVVFNMWLLLGYKRQFYWIIVYCLAWHTPWLVIFRLNLKQCRMLRLKMVRISERVPLHKFRRKLFLLNSRTFVFEDFELSQIFQFSWEFEMHFDLNIPGSYEFRPRLWLNQLSQKRMQLFWKQNKRFAYLTAFETNPVCFTEIIELT